MTGRLLNLIGQNHQVFLSAQADCGSTRDEIVELRRRLEIHRFAHRC